MCGQQGPKILEANNDKLNEYSGGKKTGDSTLRMMIMLYSSASATSGARIANEKQQSI
jgi:hypothetical protein